jgi:hypothetical protein
MKPIEPVFPFREVCSECNSCEPYAGSHGPARDLDAAAAAAAPTSEVTDVERMKYFPTQNSDPALEICAPSAQVFLAP